MRTGFLLMLAVLAAAPAPAATLRLVVLGPAGQPLSDAALMLEPANGPRPAPRPVAGAEVGQQDKRFTPSVLVVPVGTRVDFPNRDVVRHHVYSFSEAKTFEIKLYVGRPAQPILFDRPGVVTLGCNVHDSMVGWVVVTDAPWSAVTPPGGRAQFSELPPGAYRLRAWHPVLPAGSNGVEQALNLAGDTELVLRLGGGAK